MKRIIVIALLIAIVSLLTAQDKKALKDPPKQDTTVVWHKTADIKAGLKYQLEQMEAQPTFQQYKALTIQYNLLDQIQNDSLKFKKH